jgi:membrane protein
MAAVPIFLIWLSINWLIIFGAAEISYLHQHRDVERYEDLYTSKEPGARLLIELKIYLFIARRFLRGAEPPSVREIALTFNVSARDTEHFLNKLEHAGLLLSTGGRHTRYVPRRELGSTPVADVLGAMMGPIPHGDPPDIADEILRRAFDAGIRIHGNASVAEVLNEDT